MSIGRKRCGVGAKKGTFVLMKTESARPIFDITKMEVKEGRGKRKKIQFKRRNCRAWS